MKKGDRLLEDTGGNNARLSSENQASHFGVAIKRRLVSGGAWALSGKILSIFLLFAVNAIITRVLPSGDVGIYFLIYSLVTVLVLVGQLGLRGPLIVWIAQSLTSESGARAKAAILRSLWLACIGLTSIAVVLATIGDEILGRVVFSSAALADAMPLAALWLLVLGAQYVVPEVFRAFEDIPRASIYSGVLTNLLTAVLLLLAWSRWDTVNLTDVLFLSVAAGVCNALMMARPFCKVVRPLPAGGKFTTREALSVSFPFLVTNCLQNLVVHAGIWIVGIFQSEEEVALYGAAQRLVMLVGVSLQIMVAVIAPIIVRLHNKGTITALQGVLRVSTTIAAFPALFILVVLEAAGGSVLAIVFGPKYEQAETILNILCLGQFVAVYVGTAQVALLMTGHQIAVMQNTLIIGAGSILLSIPAAEHYGSLGVAFVAAVGAALSSLYMLFQVHRHIGVWTHIGGREIARSVQYLCQLIKP